VILRPCSKMTTLLLIVSSPRMPLLTGEAILRDQTPGYKCQLKSQLFNLGLELQDAVGGLSAICTTSDARNRGPDDFLNSPNNAMADRGSIFQNLFDGLADHSVKH
jgi:hypothetical protein